MLTIPEEDVQATLLAFTVKTIKSSIKKVTEAQQIFVCGGGANNNYLMKCLAESLLQYEVSTTSRLGIDPDWV